MRCASQALTYHRRRKTLSRTFEYTQVYHVMLDYLQSGNACSKFFFESGIPAKYALSLKRDPAEITIFQSKREPGGSGRRHHAAEEDF
jgi:hypothetical protein